MSFSSFRAASPSCSSAVAGPVGHRKPLLLSSLALVLLSSAAHAQNVELPTVRVETTAPSDQQGYVANRGTTATKTNTPWIEVPQSVSTITSEQLRDQKPMRFDETVRYTPGVKGETFGYDTRNDWFLLRGFTSQNEALFLDGLQLFYTSYASWKLHPFALDRIDVLRGPSSALYGGGSPGGVINATSKKPPMEPLHYVEVGVNNFGNRYFGFDIGGPAAIKTENGRFFYRLTGWAQAGDTQVDYARDDTYYINPALTWKPNMDTTLTLLASVSHNNASGLNFLPYEGTVTSAPYGRIRTSLFTSEPSLDTFRRDQQMVGYQFETALSDNVTFRQQARFAHVSVTIAQSYGLGYAGPAANATLARANFYDNPDATQLNIDNQLEVKFATGPLAHTALFGLDAKQYTIDDIGVFGGGTPLNLLNPVYTTTVRPSGAPFQSGVITQRMGGAYFQDQIKFDRWTLDLSGRYDLVSTKNENRIGPYQSGSDGQFSGRAGLSYQLPMGFAPYVTYATSYNPVIGTNTMTGALLEPETGVQTEVGVKYQPEGFNGHIAVGYFDLTRQNVLTTTPGAPPITSQTGEVSSNGIELEAVLNPMPGLKLVGAFTAYNFEITNDGSPANIGLTLPAVPEQFASVWADYTFQSGPLAGFGFGAGARYVGESYADTANTLVVPAYTLFDAAVHYEVGGWRAAINIANIADKTYVASCASPDACYYGERFRATASLGYKW